MPTARKPSKAALARLARLPHQPNLVIEGGRRPLGIYYREAGQTYQPQLALWLDATSGLIRGSIMIEPTSTTDDGVSEAITGLVDSLVTPMAVPSLDAKSNGAPRGKGKTPRLPSMAPPPAELPARIVVDDEALAAAARAIFAPLDVPVEVAPALPTFEAAFEDMAPLLGGDPNAGPPEPFAWQIDPAVLPPLYDAAARYAKQAPWQYMPDNPPLAIELGEQGPQPGVTTLYASIMGGGGQVTGIAFYYALDGFYSALQRGEEMDEAAEGGDEEIDAAIGLLRQTGFPVDEMPAGELRELVGTFIAQVGLPGIGAGGEEPPTDAFENGLVFFLEQKDECDPTYLEWLAAHKLPSSRQHVPLFLKTEAETAPRPPNEREVAALTAAIEAATQFFKQHQRILKGGMLPLLGLTHEAHTGGASGNKFMVAVQFPPPDYDWEMALSDDVEEPEQPATPAGQATVYRFQVKLEWKKSVWRRIELRGDQTLHDLHEAIQDAFEWDDDHLYAFYLSGKAWDETSAYESPYSDGRSAALHRLEHLPLRQGQQFLYIFDFGDELRHLIKLEAIAPDAVQAGVEYPRIMETHGEPVPQYPDWE